MPSKPCTDHLGNKFDSQKEMCQHWGINIGTFRQRQKLNWSLKESLCGRQLNKNKKVCVDHLGNKFDSQRKMCQYWKIEPSIFRARQKQGWSLEKSLCKKNVTDHLGNKFDSIKKMCQHWNIKPGTFRERQKRGWSLEKSLCKRQLNKNKKVCVDHLGNKFDSEAKMCQHWNIAQGTFQNRQRHGWSLKKSLCAKNDNSKSCTDHLENKFDSEKEMCRHWKIRPGTFRARQKLGWSLPESLDVIPRLKVGNRTSKTSFQNYQLTPNITIIDNVPDTDCYFICLVDNKDKTIYHRQELIDKYIEHAKSEHKKPKDVI
jgi:hypothetical protein